MYSFDEFLLHLSDTIMTHKEFERNHGHDANWAKWYAEYMVKNGLQIEISELASLLSEADNEWQKTDGQYPRHRFIAEYICK